MIFEIISISVIAVIIIAFLYTFNKNSKKINSGKAEKKDVKPVETKPAEKKEDSLTPKAETIALDDKRLQGNYLHEMSNEQKKPDEKKAKEELKFEEMTRAEVDKIIKSIPVHKRQEIENYFGKLTMFNSEFDDDMEFDDDFMGDIPDIYEDDFDISIDDFDEEMLFSNPISDEFDKLTPSMKTLIVGNILERKYNNKNDDL